MGLGQWTLLLLGIGAGVGGTLLVQNVADTVSNPVKALGALF